MGEWDDFFAPAGATLPGCLVVLVRWPFVCGNSGEDILAAHAHELGRVFSRGSRHTYELYSIDNTCCGGLAELLGGLPFYMTDSHSLVFDGVSSPRRLAQFDKGLQSYIVSAPREPTVDTLK
jgi:hypothetical protein